MAVAALGRLAQPIQGELVQGYVYQSDFAKQYVAEGRVEGRAEGRAEGRVEGLLEALQDALSIRFPRADFAAELAALAGADAELLRAALRVPLQAKGHKTARAQLAALVASKR